MQIYCKHESLPSNLPLIGMLPMRTKTCKVANASFPAEDDRPTKQLTFELALAMPRISAAGLCTC